MHLTRGQAAPDFSSTDFQGKPVSLAALRGQKVHLAFYRYAACPFCNLRLHQVRQKSGQWQQQGMQLIAVFQSPAESIAEYAADETVEFPVVGDPERELYKLYGVETSWKAMASAAKRVKDLAAATKAGFMRGVHIEGEANRVPAEFLIDENGLIQHAFYGKDIGDHLDIAIIERFVDS